MAILSPYSSSFLDTLFCNEQHDHQWSLDHHHEVQDLCWEDEELVSLFRREQEQEQQTPCDLCFDKTDPSVFLAVRKEAVDWIVKVKGYHRFTNLTAVLAIGYVDRFLSSIHFQKDKPWMIQLVAVGCLSLAAKIEETHVPFLLDLQVEDSKFLFEAKNIQKMELLVMSTLKWRMNLVTPISFLDHIVRRLGLLNHVHWNFFKKCEAIILYLVSDSRFVCYKASVLATSAMICVIDEVDPTNSIGYKSQLVDLLKTTKDDNINECYELVMELQHVNEHELKHVEGETTMYPVNPDGIIAFTCDESSNDSWDRIFHESFKTYGAVHL